METIETDSKLDVPNFIKLPILLKTSDESEETGYFKTYGRFNPMSLMSYFPQLLHENTITGAYIGGSFFYVDLPVEEFDKIVNNIDRGFSISEVKLK